MRLLTLELERYGPFTARTMIFRPNAKLHVVYGPNEAGKSCALAAVTDLFFGIERQTRYDFLHDGKELRIGGAIVGRDSSYPAFRRRKGNKSTLIDSTEGTLGDARSFPISAASRVKCFAALSAWTLRPYGGARKRCLRAMAMSVRVSSPRLPACADFPSYAAA
jgi:AAA domain-containing protein